MDENEKAAITSELAKITQSKQFVTSPVITKILEYIVAQAIEDKEDALKEFTIGRDACGLGESFDPRLNRQVSTAVGQLRNKLKEYYREEGLKDRCIIDIPKRKFIPKFSFLPDAVPPADDAGTRLRKRHRWTWDGEKKIPRRYWLGTSGAALAAVVVAIIIWALVVNRGSAEFRITIHTDRATVGPFADVTVEGWRPGTNHYLVVEPVDYTRQRWVQFKIEGPHWTRTSQFGQSDTPSGTRFRVYVLSTKSELPEGKLQVAPETPIESVALTVTLQK